MSTPRDAGQVSHVLLRGVLVGMLGGILMMLFTMLSTITYLQMGFFTPLYAIAAPLIGQSPLMTSLRQGGFYLDFGPALLGLVIHLLWAGFWGLIFGLLARRLHLTGGAAIISGLVYGVLIMLVMIFIVVPIVRAPDLLLLLGSFSFTIANALFFGITLGLWPVVQPRLFRAPPAWQAV